MVFCECVCPKCKESFCIDLVIDTNGKIGIRSYGGGK